MKNPAEDAPMVVMNLGRIVIRESSDQQYIYLKERDGERGFPIIIGSPEAFEIRRVVSGMRTERPLTHQLVFNTIRALGASPAHVDVVDLRNNTFYAQIALQDEKGEICALIDARPSDAIALALRAGCPVRVAESVLEQVRSDDAQDPIDPPPAADSDQDETPEQEE